MTRGLRLFTCGVAFMVLAGAHLAAQEASNSPTLSVGPFNGDKATIPGWQQCVGQGLSEMLVESLEKSANKFQVVESAESTEPQAGAAPGGTAPTGNKTKPRNGGNSTPQETVNVSTGDTEPDFAFYADVIQFAMRTNSSHIGDFLATSPIANLGAKLVTAQVVIDWQVQDTESKRVVLRKITSRSSTGSGFDMAAASASGKQTTKPGSAAATAVTKAAASPNNAANTGIDWAKYNSYLSGLGKALNNAPNNSANGGNGAARPPGAGAKSSGAGGDVAASDDETYGYANSEFINSALGKATSEAINDIMQQLVSASLPESGRAAKSRNAAVALRHTPGKILAVADNSTIIVSLGSNQGFKEGDQLELYETTDVKDDNGNAVFTDQKLVGELVITEVQSDRCRCSYSGDAKVQQGWTVKCK